MKNNMISGIIGACITVAAIGIAAVAAPEATVELGKRTYYLKNGSEYAVQEAEELPEPEVIEKISYVQDPLDNGDLKGKLEKSELTIKFLCFAEEGMPKMQAYLKDSFFSSDEEKNTWVKAQVESGKEEAAALAAAELLSGEEEEYFFFSSSEEKSQWTTDMISAGFNEEQVKALAEKRDITKMFSESAPSIESYSVEGIVLKVTFEEEPKESFEFLGTQNQIEGVEPFSWSGIPFEIDSQEPQEVNS